VSVPVRNLGVPPQWHPHGTRAQILADLALTPQDVAREVTGWISRLEEPTARVRIPVQEADRRASRRDS
jgi:1-deoxy-D-xylulose-5-phosphate synthase